MQIEKLNGGHFFFYKKIVFFSEMGVVFLEHPGGARYFCCMNCKAPLTNRSELVGFHKVQRVPKRYKIAE